IGPLTRFFPGWRTDRIRLGPLGVSRNLDLSKGRVECCSGYFSRRAAGHRPTLVSGWQNARVHCPVWEHGRYLPDQSTTWSGPPPDDGHGFYFPELVT